MTEMMHDDFGMQQEVEFWKNIEDVSNIEAGHFYEELNVATQSLFDGSHSQLSIIIRLLSIKFD